MSLRSVRKEEKKTVSWSKLLKGKNNFAKDFRCASRLFGNPDAVLCITCEQQLLNIRKAEEKLKLLQYEVSEKLKSLTHRISQERHRKRQHVTKDSIHPQSKRTSTQILDPLTTSVSEEYHGAFDDGDRDVHQPNDDTRATEPGECVSTSDTAQATDTMETTPGNKMPLLVSKLIK